jgi:hypothetical protein
MRVLVIFEGTNISGPAKNLLQFSKLAKSIEIALAVFWRPHDSPAFVDAAERAGIVVHRIPEKGRFDRSVIPALQELVARVTPDLIQTHAVKGHFLARYAGLHRTVPWVAFHHGYTAIDLRNRIYNQLDRWSLRAAKPLRQPRGDPPLEDQAMSQNSMPVLDADGHVTESYQQIAKYLDEPYRRRPLTFPLYPADGWDRRIVDKFHDWAGNADEWLRALDTGGMELAVLYPTLGLFMSFLKDREWAVRLCRAYNTLMHEEFIKVSPRLQSVALLPVQDPKAAALELRRMQMVAEVGAENNSTTVIMMPAEFVHMAASLSTFLQGKEATSEPTA